MTTEKKNSNPFVNMAKEAKSRNTKISADKAHQVQQAKVPKPSKGFGGSTVIRRTGRGG